MTNSLEYFLDFIQSEFIAAKEIDHELLDLRLRSSIWYFINPNDKNQILNIKASKDNGRFELTCYQLSNIILDEMLNGGFPQLHFEKRLQLSGKYTKDKYLNVDKVFDVHSIIKDRPIIRVSYEDLYDLITNSFFEAY